MPPATATALRLPTVVAQEPTLFMPPHRVLLPFPHATRIQRVLQCLTPFLAETQAYKDKWTVGRDDDGEDEYGYYRRGAGKDQKEVFHYRKSLVEMLEAHKVDWSAHKSLIEACDELYDMCVAASRPPLLELMQAISEQRRDGGAIVRDYTNRQLRADVARTPTLRIMQYDADEPGKIVARRHGDHGFATLHVYESEPGLQFGWNHVTMEDFHDVLIPPGQALLFPGRKLAHLTNWDIPALLHQVTAHSRSQRRTIVFFDHIEGEKVSRWYKH